MFFHKNATGRTASVWWFCYHFRAPLLLRICPSDQAHNDLLPTSPLSERVMGPTEQAVNVLGMLLQPWKTSRDLGKAGKPLVTFTSHSCMTNKSLSEVQVWKHLGILPPLQILKGQPPPPSPQEACPVQ